jgi:outer membrane protein assembly factor BamA
MLKKYVLGTFFISIFSGMILSQKADSIAHRRTRLYPTPIIYWSPDTKLAAGSELTYVIGQGSVVRPTILTAVALYTEKKQVSTSLAVDRYWDQNRYHATGGAGYLYFPLTFYGIGNHTRKSDAESYTPQSESLYLNFSEHISSGFYVGGQYEFDYTRIVRIQTGGNLDTNAVTGKNSGVSSGLGVTADWDTRDNILYPKHGRYYRLSFVPFSGVFGSHYAFTRLNFDLRQYFSFLRSHVLAYQIYVNMTTGDPPFYKMSVLGGPNLMRGYLRRRFRDRDMLAFQTEYRMPLFWRIGIVGFAGAGQVAHRIGDVRINDLKYSLGWGIRFLVDKKNHTNARLDMGFGKKSISYALAIQEAF